MALIYRTSDRITIKIDDITIKIAPLSYHQKNVVKELMTRGTIQRNYNLIQEGITKSIQYALKEIDGVTDTDNLPYKLQFEPDGSALTEECVGDLYNLEMHKKLVLVCSAVVKSIPSAFTDESGDPLMGVEIMKTTKQETSASPN